MQEQFSQEEIHDLVLRHLSASVNSPVEVIEVGRNIFLCHIPEEGVDFALFVRNTNSTARHIDREIRGQFTGSASAKEALLPIIDQKIPVIPLFINKATSTFMAGDPVPFTRRIKELVQNGSTVSIAYSREDRLDRAKQNGVAVRRYSSSGAGEQLVIHFRPEYLGWYLVNAAELHQTSGHDESQIESQMVKDAKAFTSDATPAGQTGIITPKTGIAAAKSATGKYGKGGESPAHKQLKYLAAGSPSAFGLQDTARPYVETGLAAFMTGDHVDVYFQGGGAESTVVEVELSGSRNIVVGIHQAVKYRALAASREGHLYNPGSKLYKAAVVAHNVDYTNAREAAHDLEVSLYTVSDNLEISLVQGIC